MPFGLPTVSAFLHGPPLLGKILENKEAGEARVQTGKRNQWGCKGPWRGELVPADGQFWDMVLVKA